jgi:hypothetical protein
LPNMVKFYCKFQVVVGLAVRIKKFQNFPFTWSDQLTTLFQFKIKITSCTRVDGVFLATV